MSLGTGPLTSLINFSLSWSISICKQLCAAKTDRHQMLPLVRQHKPLPHRTPRPPTGCHPALFPDISKPDLCPLSPLPHLLGVLHLPPVYLQPSPLPGAALCSVGMTPVVLNHTGIFPPPWTSREPLAWPPLAPSGKMLCVLPNAQSFPAAPSAFISLCTRGSQGRGQGLASASSP